MAYDMYSVYNVQRSDMFTMQKCQSTKKIEKEVEKNTRKC